MSNIAKERQKRDRLTVSLPSELKVLAKIRAYEEKRSVSDLIESLLSAYLKHEEKSSENGGSD